ncbi:hypothetical protein D3C76_1374860 [compost metagenome]
MSLPAPPMSVANTGLSELPSYEMKSALEVPVTVALPLLVTALLSVKCVEVRSLTPPSTV